MVAVAENIVRIPRIENARGFWRTVCHQLARDPVNRVCATVLNSDRACRDFRALSWACRPLPGQHDPAASAQSARLAIRSEVTNSDEMLARLIYGGRLSLLLGLLPVVCALG